MYFKISYNFDSENEKLNVEKVLKKICKMYDSYLLLGTGMYIYLFVEHHDCIDRFRRNFSKRCTLFKSKNNIRLNKNFTYEDVSVFYIQNIRRNCIIIDEKNFPENNESEDTTSEITHNQEDTLSNNENEKLSESIMSHQEIVRIATKLVILRFTDKSKYYKVLQTLEMLI